MLSGDRAVLLFSGVLHVDHGTVVLEESGSAFAVAPTDNQRAEGGGWLITSCL